MKILSCLALAMILTIRSFATESMDLDVRLLHRNSGKPYKGVTLIVYSIFEPMSAITDSRGRCRLTYGFRISSDAGDTKSIYAIRGAGDTVLLKRFHTEPKSFRLVEDQHFRTTFYLSETHKKTRLHHR